MSFWVFLTCIDSESNWRISMEFRRVSRIPFGKHSDLVNSHGTGAILASAYRDFTGQVDGKTRNFYVTRFAASFDGPSLKRWNLLRSHNSCRPTRKLDAFRNYARETHPSRARAFQRVSSLLRSFLHSLFYLYSHFQTLLRFTVDEISLRILTRMGMKIRYYGK